ncbi:MAG TPA: hypothetical protein VG052_08500, partial [Puia sp.]|nr:hypothetical protein [Puia sp.]
AFTFRYNALYYPIVASVAILLSRFQIGYKIGAILLQFVLVGAFMLFTSSMIQGMTGINQFSPVGGWHIANNALYMYEHTYREDKDPVPAKFREVDSVVRHYFDYSYRDQNLLNYGIGGGGDFYENNDSSPLRKYMYWKYRVNDFFQSFSAWGAMGSICSGYGNYLIKKHPLDYSRYYMWPNTIRYFSPPTEIFTMQSPYYLRHDDLGKMAAQQFGLKTLTVAGQLIKFRSSLFSYYPVVFALVNLFFILSFIGFCFFSGIKRTNIANLYMIFLFVLLWFCNFCFSVASASIFLRYQIFILIVQFAIGLLLAEVIYLKGEKKPEMPQPSNG